jgi:hypothetical protein
MGTATTYFSMLREEWSWRNNEPRCDSEIKFVVDLAAVLHAYSRALVGRAMSRTLDTKLAINALNTAIAHRGPPITSASFWRRCDFVRLRRPIRPIAADTKPALPSAMRPTIKASSGPGQSSICRCVASSRWKRDATTGGGTPQIPRAVARTPEARGTWPCLGNRGRQRAARLSVLSVVVRRIDSVARTNKRGHCRR